MTVWLIVLLGAIATGACAWYAKKAADDISQEQSVQNLINGIRTDIKKLPTSEELQVRQKELDEKITSMTMSQKTLEEKILKSVGQKTSLLEAQVQSLKGQLEGLRIKQRLIDSRVATFPKVMDVRITQPVPIEIQRRQPRKLLPGNEPAKPTVATSGSLLEQAGIKTTETQP